ncbi:hypothetical protein [Denitromonas iodatirespirans]|uniref:Uncharacterized protein n=1 Tax=Denitromonas iodatirespirans TaxID=2795389 RepID=A0A944DAE3_DENI1|nr:hypothetical protein [Denitromonas iodatirespirans]MBT0961707.1 hypothetical protein [Denitromonas iodatirespirans]
MNDHDRRAARSDLIRWLAEQLVDDALAERRLDTQNQAHDKRSHLRPVLNRPAERSIP